MQEIFYGLVWGPVITCCSESTLKWLRNLGVIWTSHELNLGFNMIRPCPVGTKPRQQLCPAKLGFHVHVMCNSNSRSGTGIGIPGNFRAYGIGNWIKRLCSGIGIESELTFAGIAHHWFSASTSKAQSNACICYTGKILSTGETLLKEKMACTPYFRRFSLHVGTNSMQPVYIFTSEPESRSVHFSIG